MMESLLLHASIFPKQLWNFLQSLGQQIVAIGMAVLMPLGLMFGLFPSSGRNHTQSSIAAQATVVNLIHLLPVETYEEVPQSNAVDRRGQMVERRDDRDRQLEWTIPPSSRNDSVLLPDRVVQIQLELPPTYEASLPGITVDLSALSLVVNPCANVRYTFEI